jgi:hypothetical protein
MVDRSRERGVRPIWIFLPQVRGGSWQEETPEAVRVAQEAGFSVVNLADVYEGRDIDAIRLAEWDDHPNALGHQLVAERLYRELTANQGSLLSAAATSK